MRRIRLPMSKEEKIAIRIGTILSDFSIDLELVGKYMALSNPYVVYSRAIEVLESAQYNKEVSEYREQGKYYGDGLF